MLRIAKLGQPVLRRVADPVPVEEIKTEAFQQFLDDMTATLVEQEGVGLAAPQVFVSRRVFLAVVLPVGDPEVEEIDFDIEYFINPEITEQSESTDDAWEGCLSFRQLSVKVPRSTALVVKYLDREGNPQQLALEDFPARVIQHEFDHLNGVLTIDRARSTRDIILASEMKAAEGDDAEDDE